MMILTCTVILVHLFSLVCVCDCMELEFLITVVYMYILVRELQYCWSHLRLELYRLRNHGKFLS